jgi:NAD-dependent DNA ligase
MEGSSMSKNSSRKEPSDLYGIQKYLESGLIKGIGPAYAERIVQHFGIDTLKVIDADPRRLSEVEGIGPKRIEMIASCWHLQRGIREVMVFLQSNGVTTGFCSKNLQSLWRPKHRKGQTRSVFPSKRYRRDRIYDCRPDCTENWHPRLFCDKSASRDRTHALGAIE